MSFAENLKQLRKEKRLSQEELAEILDVSRQAIYLYMDIVPKTAEKYNIKRIFVEMGNQIRYNKKSNKLRR